ncbi:MAG: PleD family two-component system response regulator [Rhodovibrionaceae bacterium]
MTGRILIVDDVEANVKLLEAKLTSEYFDILTAHDGETALEVARSQSPDLILLDVMMPGMDGIEVCRILRGDSRTAHIPIVMLTALSDIEDRVRGLEAGADDFLSKPANDLTLFSRVRSLIRLKMMIDELRTRQSTTDDAAGLTMAEIAPEADGGILLIEADAIQRENLSAKLEAAGHGVFLAETAQEGMALARDKDPDLVIVALDLGAEDGLRFVSQLRSDERLRHVPVLMLLDDYDLARLAKGLDIGVTDYLIKPIDGNELQARVRTQVRRRRYHEKLRELLDQSVSMAYTDGLTGVYNRRYLESHLDKRLAAASASGKPLSVMMIDIDSFKAFNDRYGHALGDLVLRAVAAALSDNVRNIDLVARYGGEEFAVVMPDTGADGALLVAERLRDKIDELRVAVEGQEDLRVTVSIGVATAMGGSESASLLQKRADGALYRAKGTGRNRVISDELDRPESALAARA